MTKTILRFFILITLLTACTAAGVSPTITPILSSQTPQLPTEAPFPLPTPTPIPIGITEVASLSKGSAGFVEWSPDRTIYVISGTLGVHIYDAKSNKETKYIPREIAYDVAFTADSQLMAIGSFDYLTIIRLSDEKVLFEKDESMPSEIEFSPKDSSLAYLPGCLSYECNAIVVVSDYSTQKDLFTLNAGAESEGINLNQIAFNMDGALLAASSSNGSIYIWDISTGKLKTALKGHRDSVTGVKFSPANKPILASYSDDGTVKLWNVETEQIIKTLGGFQGKVEKISYSSDGSSLEIFTNTAVQTYDIAIEKIVSKEKYIDTDALLLQELPSSEGYIGNVDALAYSPDGQTLAVSDHTTSPAVLWDTSTKKIKATLDTKAAKMVYSHQGKLLASVDENGEVTIWETSHYSRLDTIQTKRISSLIFSPDDSKIAVSSQWKVSIWDISRSKITQAINTGIEETILLSYSSDGNTISAVDPNDFSVKSWDVSTGKLIHTFTPPSNSNYREVINLSNNILAVFKQTDTSNNTVELWNIDTGEQLQTLEGVNDYTSPRLAYSPDRKVVAVSYYYGITFYCSNTANPLYVYDQVVNWVKFSFSPDGNHLAMGDDYGRVVIWDVSRITQNSFCAIP